MRTNVVTVEENDSVTEASKKMSESREGCAIVLKEGRPFGIVTERDVAWKVAGCGLDPKLVKVAEIMSKPVITIDADADLLEAAKAMRQHKIRRLAVEREDNLKGIITAADVSRNLEAYLDSEVRDALRYLWSPQYTPQDS